MERFYRGQCAVLERIAEGCSLAESLTDIVRLIEGMSAMECSVLLLDASGTHVRHGAAPSLPQEYVRLLDGAPIGPDAGSCGAAAYHGKTIIVEDLATHPNWRDYRDAALPHGLRACWSSPIFDPDGKVLGTFAMYYREPRGPTARETALVEEATHIAAVAIGRARAEAERRELEAQLQRNQRLQSLGTLAAGIAHDFNNILTAIGANAEFAREAGAAPEDVSEALAEIQQATRRATTLVRQILAFGNEQPARKETLDIRKVIGEVLDLLRSSLPPQVEIATDFGSAPLLTQIDPTQLHQVVLNLVTNAVHALGERGTVDVVAQPYLHRSGAGGLELADGKYARLSVTDSGRGMDEATLAQAFDPFFTTKPTGEGTGLGLSIVHGIMRGHGGAIRVRSELGAGTSFDLYFPVVEDAHPAVVGPGRACDARR